jgi:tetratricopeptide (TPR) repeat protein
MSDDSSDTNFLLGLAFNELRDGRPEEALARIRDLIPDLSGAPEHLAPARALEARALASLGRGEEALSLLESAAREAGAAGLRDHENGLRGLREGLAQQIEMSRLADLPVEEIERQVTDPGGRAVLLANKAIACLARGDLDAARSILPIAREAADAAGEPDARVPVLLAAAQVSAADEDLPKARRALNEARALAVQHAPEALPLIDEMKKLIEGSEG